MHILRLLFGALPELSSTATAEPPRIRIWASPASDQASQVKVAVKTGRDPGNGLYTHCNTVARSSEPTEPDAGSGGVCNSVGYRKTCNIVFVGQAYNMYKGLILQCYGCTCLDLSSRKIPVAS